ncbi:hypothetical protein [Aquirufa antheringensis]|uniref:hypothetical protein n=1 Tax=Aquirufa antheringensis TaxID=2516559 RepID=UPI001032994A|nr:hypothetical protein [Aquirufa antheringensis]TBH70010.1 hypothetical protein EWU21_09875 [Aquirufa antheringensis]
MLFLFQSIFVMTLFTSFMTPSIIFLKSRGSLFANPNIYLAVLFFIAGIYCLTIYSMSLGHSLLFTVLLYGNFSSIYFLIGPFLYFYLRSLRTGSTHLHGKDFWHFIPFILVFIDTIPYYVSPYAYKIEVVRQVFSDWTSMFRIQLGFVFNAAHLYVLRPLLLSFYTFWGMYYLKRNQVYFYKATNLGRWIMLFLFFQWMVFVGMSSVFFGVWLDNTFGISLLNHPSEIKYLSLVSYMIMVCTLYFFPQVIYLNADRFKRILNPQEAYWWKMDQALNATYIFDKPFLDPFLSLDQFGELVQKDTREIRDFFELYLFTSFTDEMNRLRVQFAKNLIKQGCQQKACLNNLYKDSGFARAEDLEHYFSEFEGLTVKEFILTLK